MNWQETLMHIEDLHEQRLPRTYVEMWAELEKQAERSSKAGYDEGYKAALAEVGFTRSLKKITEAKMTEQEIRNLWPAFVVWVKTVKGYAAVGGHWAIVLWYEFLETREGKA